MSQSDQDINEIFKIFAGAVRTVLRDMYENSIPVTVLETKIDLVSKTLSTVLETKQVYPIERLFQKLKELDEIKKYLDFMLNGGEFSKRLEELIIHYLGGWLPINDLAYRSRMFLEFLKTLVDEYKERFGCNFTEQNFKTLFDELTNYIYAKDREIVIVTPLANFELKGADEITIGKYKIRKPSEWEIEELIADPFIKTSLDFNRINIFELWLLEIVTKDVKIDVIKLLPNIDELLRVMRLFKKGYVAGGTILMKYLKAPKIFYRKVSPSFVILPSCITPLGAVTKYSLDINEVDGLRQLWNLYNRVKSNLSENLKIVLERFTKSYEKGETEDKILDLAIAFELMFGRRDYDILVPRFISNDYNERKKIAEVLRNLRRERDNIVHEGRSKSELKDLEAIAVEAEEIFRKTYIKLLKIIDENKGKEFKKIREEIIDKILYDEQ